MRAPPLLLTLCLGSAIWGCETETAAPTPVKPTAKSMAGEPRQAASMPTPKIEAETATDVSSAPTTEVGKNLYETVCAACHGSDGSGRLMRKSLPGIGDLTDPALHARLNDAAMVKVISQGQGQMPGFGSMLTAEKTQAIVTYTRTLQDTSGKPAHPQ